MLLEIGIGAHKYKKSYSNEKTIATQLFPQRPRKMREKEVVRNKSETWVHIHFEITCFARMQRHNTTKDRETIFAFMFIANC